MRVKFLSFYNEEYEDIYKLTSPRMIEFCNLNKYSHTIQFIKNLNKNEVRVFKSKLILDNFDFDKFDYIIYSDIDILIKKINCNIFKDYDFKKDITFSSDEDGLCSGFIVIKLTEFSKKFFDTCLFLKYHNEINCNLSGSLQHWNGRYDRTSEADQELIKSLYYGYEKIRDNIDTSLPEEIVSNQQSSLEQIKKSFAYHYWSRCLGVNETISQIQYYLHATAHSFKSL